jgi:biotin carboxyl carrier protein
MKYQLEINQKNFDVTISSVSGNMARIVVNGEPYDVRIGKSPEQPMAAVSPGAIQPAPVHADLPPRVPEAAPVITPQIPAGPVEGDPILAPIPGLILEIKVAVGEMVTAGQSVAIIEAMKMENSIAAHVSGKVRDIRVQKGSQVSTRDVIMIIG